MKQIIIFCLAIVTCLGQYPASIQPHSEYGVPAEYRKLTTDFEIPKEVLSIDVRGDISATHDSHGTPKEEYGEPKAQTVPIVTQYDYVIPHVEKVVTPPPEYGVPKTHEEYGAPHLNELVPALPAAEYGTPQIREEYGVPKAAPVVTQYDYVIPHVEKVVTPPPEYGVPKTHEEYGAPHLNELVPALPAAEYGTPQIHEEYGVPKAVPMVTQYDYVIPRVEKVVTPTPEYGVPKTHEEYGAPHHNEPVPAPPTAEYGIPQIHEEYGVPKAAPVVTQYDYVIPRVEKVVTPTPEYGVPKTHEEYGAPHHNEPVPAPPAAEYGIPQIHEEYGVPKAAPVVTQYDYVIPRVEKVETPAPEYGVPKVHDEEYGAPHLNEIAPAAEYGIPKIHEDYGVPNKPSQEYAVLQKNDIAPVVTVYEYVIPHVEPVLTPAAENGIPYGEYGVPHSAAVPNKPHDEYGVPDVKQVDSVETHYDYVIPHVETVAPVAPAIQEEYVAPNKPHDEYSVPNKPHDEYRAPYGKQVAPVVTHFEYVIPHAEVVAAPVAEHGVPKLHEEYGVSKTHEEYGVPKAVVPVESTYTFATPGIRAPEALLKEEAYAAPKIHEEYGVPMGPVVVPHAVYGVPTH